MDSPIAGRRFQPHGPSVGLRYAPASTTPGGLKVFAFARTPVRVCSHTVRLCSQRSSVFTRSCQIIDGFYCFGIFRHQLWLFKFSAVAGRAGRTANTVPVNPGIRCGMESMAAVRPIPKNVETDSRKNQKSSAGGHRLRRRGEAEEFVAAGRRQVDLILQIRQVENRLIGGVSPRDQIGAALQNKIGRRHRPGHG